MIRTIPNIMERYGCDAEHAQRYMDLRDEGYSVFQAELMAGLSDPPEFDEEFCEGNHFHRQEMKK